MKSYGMGINTHTHTSEMSRERAVPDRSYIEYDQVFQVIQFPDAVYMKYHQFPEAPAL